MRKKTIILAAGLIVMLALAGLAIGTKLLVKTQNKDFKTDPEFYKSLGNYFVDKGEADKAINAYESSLLLGEDSDARNNLAVLYYKQGSYDEAITHLRILVSQYPDNPSYHYDLAVNLVDNFRSSTEQSISELEEALSEYEQAEALQPGYARAKDNVEVLKKVLGQSESFSK
jgi:tetratricopeptide (TPR) repeat protein